MSWTNIRDAIQAAHKKLGRPDFDSLSDTERDVLWAFAEVFAENYQPEKRACFGCGKEFPWAALYRCWDCKSVCCEHCIKIHFGQQHRPHPMTAVQWAAEFKEVEGIDEDLRVDLRDLDLTTKISERTKRKLTRFRDFASRAMAELRNYRLE